MAENSKARVLGYCEECGAKITDDTDDIYVDESGHYFDDLDCVLTHYGIYKLEF